jgi:hypothetical protein
MGTIEVKWEDVTAIQSEFYFRVETSAGRRLFGSLELREDSDMLVVSGETTASVEYVDVVEIVPIEQNFWQRNDGSLSLGFSFTKGSDVAQLTFNWNNLYRTERNIVNARWGTILTNKGEGQPTTTRLDIVLTYYRLLRKKWTGNLTGAVQRNDELGLKRRFLFGAGTGLNAIKSNHNVLLLSVGIALNSELGTDTTKVTHSAEGVLAANYSFFRYKSPKSDISTSLNFFPSLTEKDRYRLDFDISYRQELVTDFFFDLSYYLNYDSKPTSADASKRDYGIVTSVGWSY